VVQVAHDVALAEAGLVARKLVEPHIAQGHRRQPVVVHQQPRLCTRKNSTYFDSKDACWVCEPAGGANILGWGMQVRIIQADDICPLLA